MGEKIAVITGAANGIGAALTRKALKNGYYVYAIDKEPKALARRAQNQSNLTTYQADVTSAEQMQDLAQHIFAQHKAVHLLFNNAGIVMPGRIGAQDLAHYKYVLEVNLYGVLHGIYAFLPFMRKQKQAARIVNTASISGLIASPLFGAYTASKHAVIALSETLSFELAQDNLDIAVSVIAPGAVATDIMRPHSDMQPHSPEIEKLMQRMDQRTQKTGMAPDSLADFVFTKIAENAFWIIPHDDQLYRLRQRADDIIKGINPQFNGWTKS